ncbi:MAG: hypothetical protein HFJ12_00940 [Bacilli bacterium]|nr:hypothetical protein [Bacilli bacterium]
MKKINTFIDKNMNKIVIIFLFLQPIIDVVTAIMLHTFKINFTAGVVLRVLFLLFMIYYLFFINQNESKKKSLLYVIAIIIYIILFSFHIICAKKIGVLGSELKNVAKTFYFPILLVCMYDMFKGKKNIIKPRFLNNLFITYGLFVLIPNLLGFGFDSYTVTKSGSIGLFYTANEISAILSILMPIFIYIILEKKNYFLTILSGVILLYTLTSIGTKGPFLSFLIICFYYLVCYIYHHIKRKKYKIVMIASLVFISSISIFIFVIPKTSFYKNIVIHLEFLEVKKASDIIKNPKVLDHFVFSERLSFWKEVHTIYQGKNMTSKILGIGYLNFDNQSSMKMIEMDYVDIFYRHGIVGFLIYMSGFFYMILKIVKKYFNNTTMNSRNKIVQAYMLSIVLSIILSLLTGHVILSPSVSIFVALILNLLYNELYKGEFRYG